MVAAAIGGNYGGDKESGKGFLEKNSASTYSFTQT
jgi:hypothetical protein